MKLFYQLVGLVLGFIIGILTAISSLAIFGLWVYSDTKKPTSKYRDFNKGSEKYKLENPLEHRYASRTEAEMVLDILNEIILENGFTTVQDLALALNIPATFADRKRGWKNLNDVSIDIGETENGVRPMYTIHFPKPQTF